MDKIKKDFILDSLKKKLTEKEMMDFLTNPINKLNPEESARQSFHIQYANHRYGFEKNEACSFDCPYCWWILDGEPDIMKPHPTKKGEFIYKSSREPNTWNLGGNKDYNKQFKNFFVSDDDEY